jgi:hypothetical protein
MVEGLPAAGFQPAARGRRRHALLRGQTEAIPSVSYTTMGIASSFLLAMASARVTMILYTCLNSRANGGSCGARMWEDLRGALVAGRHVVFALAGYGERIGRSGDGLAEAVRAAVRVRGATSTRYRRTCWNMPGSLRNFA